MLSKSLSLAAAVAIAFVPVVLLAADDSKPEEEPAPEIRVQIVGKLKTGIVAIGAETTGIVIQVKNVTWELDLHDDPKLLAAAKKLDNKLVRVKGTYERREGVEVAERHIVTVTSIKPASAGPKKQPPETKTP